MHRGRGIENIKKYLAELLGTFILSYSSEQVALL